MKITSVGAIPLRLTIPHAPYVTDGAGSKFHRDGRRSRITPKRPTPVLEYVLVRIDTDLGVTGWGESQADVGFFGHTVEDVMSAVNDYLGPQLIGRDPFERAHLMALVDFRGHSTAKAGIDMALHDLAGRALGASVGQILGGRGGGRIGVSIEIAGGAPDAMAHECVRLVAAGVREFKAKIGWDPDADADRLSAIRDAVGPNVKLRADANQGYTPKEAIRFCRIVERRDLGLGLLEQPVAHHDLEGMALVRAAVETPICADEACYGPADALRIVRAGAADVLNVKIGKAGGLAQAAKILAIGEAAGLRCVLGTAFGTGLEIAAKLHLAAAHPEMTDGVECTELTLHRSLVSAGGSDPFTLPLADGALPVPTGAGLGVDLEAAAMRGHALGATVPA